MEVNKRLIAFVVLSVFMISMFAGFVSANEVTEFMDSVASAIGPIFAWIFGDPVSQAGDLTVRVLAFFLVLVIIYGLLDQVKIVKKGWMNFVIGLIVSLIGIRFLPADLLASMTEPASALVALIFLGIPFLVAGFLIMKVDKGPMRRAFWIAYGVLVLVMFIYKWNELGFKDSYAWVDFILLIAILGAFLFDGTIQKRFFKGQIKEITSKIEDESIARRTAELAGLTKDYDAMSASAKKSLGAVQLKKRIDQLRAELT
jgi:hypothetical protein